MRIFALAALLLTSILLTATPASADTVTLTAASLATGQGATGSGQTVANVAVQDQSGTADDWNKYLELLTPGVTYRGDLTFNVPASVTQITGLQLKVNYRGPAKADQRWYWSILSNGSWTVFGDNAAAPDWGSWKLLTANAPTGGVVQNGQIRIRIQSSNAADDADLDYVGLTVTHSTGGGGTWVPAKTDRWQYQLQPTATGAGTVGGVRLDLCGVPYSGGSCVSPNVYDIDLYGPDKVTPNAAAVTAIHAAGGHAICYVSAGSWEDWRPDKDSFPASVKGNDMDGWPGEKWLDIRQRSVLLPIMQARVAKCDQAGFDSVEYDNVDAFQNDNTGFPLTSADQLAYNKALADLAHSYGLSVGLKNDLDQVGTLVDWFDYAVNESCQTWSECAMLKPFLDKGKAVFQIEYTDEGGSASAACPPANTAGRSAILKTLDLTDTPWTPCR